MKLFYTAILLATGITFSNANNVLVQNTSLTGQNTGAGVNNAANYTSIQFDVSWDNSWNSAAGPSNWDAVWIFAKYKIVGGAGCIAGGWNHCTLSTTAANHTITTNNGVAGTITPSTDGKGVFMYRSATGTGSNNWQQVLLRWNYGADGVLDACQVTVKVYAIEMVYIPTGTFYVGDGIGAAPAGNLTAGTASTAAYQVLNENAITLGGAGGNVGNNNGSGQSQGDDWNTATQVTLPAVWPKGYTKYYLMKYECSNEQYSEFLKTLTFAQQGNRFPATTTAAPYNASGAAAAAPTFRNAVKVKVAGNAANPADFGCDLNNDGTYNGANDGQYIPYSSSSVPDLLAYLDWAALRPMSEFEYEKGCRGNQVPVAGEYAWGSNSIYAASYLALSNSGAVNELPNSPSAGPQGNAVYSTTVTVGNGPLRCGIFATAASTRVVAGAGYYGAMEMTGSCFDMVVNCATVAGRSFDGSNHGDGSLSATGYANATTWPGANGNNAIGTTNAGVNAGSTGGAGMGLKGGDFNEAAYLLVSARQYIQWPNSGGRDYRMGIRGVRTSP